MDLQELHDRAREELARHQLRDWTFALGRGKRRLGVCKYHSKRIEISAYYAEHNSRESVIDTLLHEVAHALAGPAANHGPVWQAIAARLGATPRACENSKNVVVKPGDWQATCPSCSRTYHRYRRPRPRSHYRCRCPARSTVEFVFAGEAPAWSPPPPSLEEAANWEAVCAGCGTRHFRIRRPKEGRWLCRCPQRCEIIWRPKSG